MSKQITEEMNLHKQWYKDAKEQTLETLPAFLKELSEHKHDVGTIVHAITASALAAAFAMNASPQGRISVCQGWFVTVQFIFNLWYTTNKCGLRILDYDDMLYPRNEVLFRKTITSKVWESLQEEAKNKLEKESAHAHPDTIVHWQSIVDGVVPFGYEVTD